MFSSINLNITFYYAYDGTWIFQKVEDQKSTELPITNEKVIELHANSRQKITKKRKIKIFYGTQTGNAKVWMI